MCLHEYLFYYYAFWSSDSKLCLNLLQHSPVEGSRTPPLWEPNMDTPLGSLSTKPNSSWEKTFATKLLERNKRINIFEQPHVHGSFYIHLNCFCIEPNHNIPNLKVLYIVKSRWAALWRLWREKTPLLTGRNLENQTQWVAICLDRFGGGGGGGCKRGREERERRGEEERGETTHCHISALLDCCYKTKKR